MSRDKETGTTEWINASETLKVLEEVNGRPIHPKYLHILAKQNRIARIAIDKRTYLYSKQDAKRVHIAERKGAGRKKNAA